MRPEDRLDLIQPQRKPRGRVGIGDHHVLPRNQIGLDVDGEVRVQRHGPRPHAEQLRKHGIEAVADLREGYALLSAEGQKREGQNLIRAVASDHLVSLQPVKLRDGAYQIIGGGIAVQAQILHLGAGDGLDHPRTGRIGALVGVQLDELAPPGLLAGGIGYQRRVARVEKTAHDGSSSKRLSMLRAWPSRPSMRAKRATSPQT